MRVIFILSIRYTDFGDESGDEWYRANSFSEHKIAISTLQITHILEFTAIVFSFFRGFYI